MWSRYEEFVFNWMCPQEKVLSFMPLICLQFLLLLATRRGLPGNAPFEQCQALHRYFKDAPYLNLFSWIICLPVPLVGLGNMFPHFYTLCTPATKNFWKVCWCSPNNITFICDTDLDLFLSCSQERKFSQMCGIFGVQPSNTMIVAVVQCNKLISYLVLVWISHTS